MLSIIKERLSNSTFMKSIGGLLLIIGVGFLVRSGMDGDNEIEVTDYDILDDINESESDVEVETVSAEEE